MNYLFNTKCTHLIENNQERHFPPFSRPLFSQPSQINVNLSDYYGEIMTSVGKLVFSLPREDISVQTVARPPITKNFQDSELFCLGGSYKAKCYTVKWLTPSSDYCEVYRMIFSWVESLPSNTRGWHDKGGPGVTRFGNINLSILSKEQWPSDGENQFPFPQLMQSFWRGTHQLSWSR